MFTVEMEHDATVITTMDQRDEFEDVECIISDDGVVFMRQWNEGANNHDLLYLSFQQLTDWFFRWYIFNVRVSFTTSVSHGRA
jgi:hypothetical protein